jgi:hypothetical protein
MRNKNRRVILLRQPLDSLPTECCAGSRGSSHKAMTEGNRVEIAMPQPRIAGNVGEIALE